MIGKCEGSLSSDVLRQIKRDELKNRIFIIVISGALLLATNFFWFIVWNAPPKDREEITFEFEEDGNDTPQSEDEKSE